MRDVLCVPHNQPVRFSYGALGDRIVSRSGVDFASDAQLRIRHIFVSVPTFIMEDSKNSKNVKPVEVLRLRGVSASIYANNVRGRSIPLYKVSLKRTYRKDGEFKSVTALGRDDLPIASLLLSQAWQRILEMEGEHWAEADEAPAEME